MTTEFWKHDETCWVYGIIFIDLKSCGCGFYDDRLEVLKETLNALLFYGRENTPDYLKTPLGEWFLCLLTDSDLIDHGTSIGGSWITDKGKRVLTVLNDEKEYQRLIDNEWDMGMCECMVCNHQEKK